MAYQDEIKAVRQALAAAYAGTFHMEPLTAGAIGALRERIAGLAWGIGNAGRHGELPGHGPAMLAESVREKRHILAEELVGYRRFARRCAA